VEITLNPQISSLTIFEFEQMGEVRGGILSVSKRSVNPATFPNAGRKELISYIDLARFSKPVHGCFRP